MGLDCVEIVMGWEEAFGISIANEEAFQIRTSRMAIELIVKKLNAVESAPYCLTARAFYKLRRALTSVSAAPRVAITPEAKVHQVFPSLLDRAGWNRVGEELGLSKFTALDRGVGWVLGGERIRNVADWLALRLPRSFMSPGERWSRNNVRMVVRGVVTRTTGIRDFSDDDDFVQDLHLD